MFGVGTADRSQLESRIQIVTLVSGSIAILSPIQAQLNTWLPGPVSIGLTVGGVLGALTAQVGQQVVNRRTTRSERDRLVRDLLRHPDLPTAAEVEPLELGVYRPKPSYADLPYIDRDIDPALDVALGENRFVVVLGPRLAGKTRCLVEAVRRNLPDAQLVCPRNPSSLERLLDPAVPVRVTASSAVLWLDDLDRYLGGILDDGHLERLAGADIDVTVAGTLREDAFTRAMGQTSSRMLLDAAQVVRLPADLSPGEQQRVASRLGHHVPGPLGEELALHAPSAETAGTATTPAASTAVTPSVPAAEVTGPSPAPAAATLDRPAPSPPAASPPLPPPTRIGWQRPAGGDVYPAPPSPAPSPTAGAPSPAPPPAPGAPPPKRRGRKAVISGLVLGACAVLLPLAAVPAIGLGVYALARRRYIGGAVTIVVAVVGAVLGVLLVLTLDGEFDAPEADPPFLDSGDPTPADDGEIFTPSETTEWLLDASDVAVLGDYFDARYIACSNGLTPEWPNCDIVYDAASQEAWLRQHGYDRCRLDGNSASSCVAVLPGW